MLLKLNIQFVRKFKASINFKTVIFKYEMSQRGQKIAKSVKYGIIYIDLYDIM